MDQSSSKASTKSLFNFNGIYWASVIITAAICYGFMLTNPTVTLEDMWFHFYYFGGYIIAQGRWGPILLRRVLNSYMFLPYWRNFFALIIMVFGISVSSGLLKKYSYGKFDNTAAAIFSCISISFPHIAYMFIFSTTTVEISMVYLFAAISLFFALKFIVEKKDFWFGIISAIILGYAISFYEYAIFFYLIIGFGLLLVNFLFEPDEELKEQQTFLKKLHLTHKESLNIDNIPLFRDNPHLRTAVGTLCRHYRKLTEISQHNLVFLKLNIFVKFVKLILIAIAAILIWRLGAAFFQHLNNISPNIYSDRFILHDRTSLATFLRSIISFIFSFHRVFINWETNTVNWFKIGASIALIASSIAFSIRKKNCYIFFAGFLGVASAYGLYFITGNYTLLPRMLFHFSVLIGFCIALLYAAFPLKIRKLYGINFRNLLVIIAVWIVFIQSREMNQLYLLNYQRYRRDVFIMETIMHDLKGLGNYKPVVFVGAVPELSQRDLIGLSAINFMRDTSMNALNSYRATQFFAMHNHALIPFPPSYLDVDVIKSQISDMAMWPREGYIREFDDYIIIRLGPAIFELPAEETPVVTEVFTIGEITNETEILWIFDPQKAEIQGVSIKFATYGRVNTSHILLELGRYDELSSTKIPLYNRRISALYIEDSHWSCDIWHNIVLAQPIALEEGLHYLLLTSDDAEQGNAVTVWTMPNRDITGSSRLFIDGVERDWEMMIEIN